MLVLPPLARLPARPRPPATTADLPPRGDARPQLGVDHADRRRRRHALFTCATRAVMRHLPVRRRPAHARLQPRRRYHVSRCWPPIPIGGAALLFDRGEGRPHWRHGSPARSRRAGRHQSLRHLVDVELLRRRPLADDVRRRTQSIRPNRRCRKIPRTEQMRLDISYVRSTLGAANGVVTDLSPTEPGVPDHRYELRRRPGLDRLAPPGAGASALRISPTPKKARSSSRPCPKRASSSSVVG